MKIVNHNYFNFLLSCCDYLWILRSLFGKRFTEKCIEGRTKKRIFIFFRKSSSILVFYENHVFEWSQTLLFSRKRKSRNNSSCFGCYRRWSNFKTNSIFSIFSALDFFCFDSGNIKMYQKESISSSWKKVILQGIQIRY